MHHLQKLRARSDPIITVGSGDWILETFTVNREELTKIVALHLDFGILRQKSIRILIPPAMRATMEGSQFDANKRASNFVNYASAKFAAPKLKLLIMEYFATTKSLKSYLRSEVVSESPRHGLLVDDGNPFLQLILRSSPTCPPSGMRLDGSPTLLSSLLNALHPR
jgi:hypothetical protein